MIRSSHLRMWRAAFLVCRESPAPRPVPGTRLTVGLYRYKQPDAAWRAAGGWSGLPHAEIPMSKLEGGAAAQWTTNRGGLAAFHVCVPPGDDVSRRKTATSPTASTTATGRRPARKASRNIGYADKNRHQYWHFIDFPAERNKGHA